MRITEILSLGLIFLLGCSSKSGSIQQSKPAQIDDKLVFIERTNYVTDSADNIQKEIKNINYYDAGKVVNEITEEIIYEYSNQGDLLTKKTYTIFPEQKELSEITKFRKDVEEKYRFRDGDTISYELTVAQNDLVHLSMKDIKLFTGEAIQGLTMNKFDNDNNLIQSDEYTLDKKLLSTSLNKYDSNNKIEKKEVYSPENELLRTIYYTHILEDNLETETQKDENGNTIQIDKKIFKNRSLICEIWKMPGIQIDSFYYSNDKLIKEVHIPLGFPGKDISTYEYDSNGRISEQRNYLY